MKKNRNVTQIIEKEVTQLLISDPQYTAEALKRDAEKRLKKKGYNYKFTPRTYSNIKNRVLPNLNEGDSIDIPWSFGSLKQHPLPEGTVDIVLGVQRAMKIQNQDYKLTIRDALWLVPVYQALRYVERIRERDKRPYADVMRWWFPITLVYSMHDRITSILEINFDTTLFDDLFFESQRFFDSDDKTREKQINLWLDEDKLRQDFLNISNTEIIEKDGGK